VDRYGPCRRRSGYAWPPRGAELAGPPADFFELKGIVSNVLVGPETQGERIRIEGRVFDGSGSPCRDTVFTSSRSTAIRFPHPRRCR